MFDVFNVLCRQNAASARASTYSGDEEHAIQTSSTELFSPTSAEIGDLDDDDPNEKGKKKKVCDQTNKASERTASC